MCADRSCSSGPQAASLFTSLNNCLQTSLFTGLPNCLQASLIVYRPPNPKVSTSRGVSHSPRAGRRTHSGEQRGCSVLLKAAQTPPQYAGSPLPCLCDPRFSPRTLLTASGGPRDVHHRCPLLGAEMRCVLRSPEGWASGPQADGFQGRGGATFHGEGSPGAGDRLLSAGPSLPLTQVNRRRAGCPGRE